MSTANLTDEELAAQLRQNRGQPPQKPPFRNGPNFENIYVPRIYEGTLEWHEDHVNLVQYDNAFASQLFAEIREDVRCVIDLEALMAAVGAGGLAPAQWQFTRYVVLTATESSRMLATDPIRSTFTMRPVTRLALPKGTRVLRIHRPRGEGV